MAFKSPMLKYMREVLDEHTLPLEDNNSGMIEAVWLVEMIHHLEAEYKANGLL